MLIEVFFSESITTLTLTGVFPSGNEGP